MGSTVSSTPDTAADTTNVVRSTENKDLLLSKKQSAKKQKEKDRKLKADRHWKQQMVHFPVQEEESSDLRTSLFFSPQNNPSEEEEGEEDSVHGSDSGRASNE